MKPIQNQKQNSRGIALITTLLLLSLFTIMTLGMVISVTSDTLIDGYYRNARASFYASDSGLNAARQYLQNQIALDVPSTYVPTTTSGPPTLSLSAQTILSNLENTTSGFGGYQSIIGSQTSWPGNFKVDSTAANTWILCAPGTSGCSASSVPACSPVAYCTAGADATKVASAGGQYQFLYPYQLTVIGQSRNSEQNTVVETGQITLTVSISTGTSTVTSFAAFGTLLDQYALCTGGAFVPGTMSGKFFSNDSWNFGDPTANGSSTKYIFTGNVGAVNSQVGYIYGNGTCDKSSAKSDSHGGSTISPTFTGGLTLGQTAIPMPSNSYNQIYAILDGLGDCPPAPAACTAPSNAAMGALHTAGGTAWTSSASSGVYVPWTSTTGPPATKTLNSGAGGIYVQGTANSVTLTASTSGSGSSAHSLQLITIAQGSTTTTVTLDLTAGTTTLADNAGHTTGAMTGLPQNLNFSPSTEACLVYVNGPIGATSGGTTTGLTGSSSGAAIQNGSAITVVSTGAIDITGNITYSTEPVTLNSADTATSPAPTNVLGIYSSGGNVNLMPTSNVSTLEVDAAIATIASGGSYGITAVWNNITNFNLVGGRVQNKALSGASIGARNIYFDQRFSTGFAPPWFPTTSITSSSTATATVQPPSINRISWVNKTSE